LGILLPYTPCHHKYVKSYVILSRAQSGPNVIKRSLRARDMAPKHNCYKKWSALDLVRGGYQDGKVDEYISTRMAIIFQAAVIKIGQ
jgi:hypothetical protein